MKIELDLPVPEGWRYKSDDLDLLGKTDKYLWITGELTFERIEPEDEELEQAKKLIGKWVKSKKFNVIYQVESAYRVSEKEIMLASQSFTSLYDSCAPFPLPVWRCCESDKPKVGRYYPVRKNKSLTYDLIRFDGSGFWDTDLLISKYEWLDEGDV
jgi:hypothetical protein